MIRSIRVLKWHIILVNLTYYEGGAKNPSKGTSMKLLVFAFDAQSGADAGRKDVGRSAMACGR